MKLNLLLVIVGLNVVVSNSLPPKSYRKLTNYDKGDGQSIEDDVWSTDNMFNDISEPLTPAEASQGQKLPEKETVKPEVVKAVPEVTSAKPEVVSTVQPLPVRNKTKAVGIDGKPATFTKPSKVTRPTTSTTTSPYPEVEQEDGFSHFLKKIWNKNGKGSALSQILAPEKVSHFLRNVVYNLPGETRVHGVVSLGGSAFNFDMTKNGTEHNVWKSEVDKVFEFVDANVQKIEAEKKEKRPVADYDPFDFFGDSAAETGLMDKIDNDGDDDDDDFETFLLDFFNGFTEEMGGDSFLRNVANVGLMSAVGIMLFAVMSFVMVIAMTAMFVPVMIMFAFPLIFFAPLLLAFGQ